MAESSESFGVELRAARACRAFRERAKERADPRRRAELAEFASNTYRDRLRIPVPEGAIRDVADPDSIVIEMAHDGQLPHLGIVRLVLKAHDIAEADGRGVVLYLVGNHYSAAMRPENIRFGMPLNGQAPDDVKHPPKLRIGKANAHTPFRWLPPPSREDLVRLQDQVRDFVTNNVAHEEKIGTVLVPDARERIFSRLDAIFEILGAAGDSVESFGDWLVRVQHDLFQRMLGPGAERILFLPMADVTSLLRPEMTTLARNSEKIARAKAEVSAGQAARGEEPYMRAGEPSAFWIHCPACKRRQRVPWSPERSLDFACRHCGERHRLEGQDLWDWMVPDIVAYEAALFRLGIDGWVVGSHASYHPVIERVCATVFADEVPPTFFLTSVPTFRGIGDPPGGFRRTRLLRALLEMEPASIAAALRAPWASDPVLRSDLLSR